MATNKNNFESQLTELEKIVANLESGNIPLEQALDQFKAGVEISRSLEKKLTHAQETVAKLIDENGNEHKLDPQDSAAPEE